MKTSNLFGGVKNSYIVPTYAGLVKVTCNNPFDFKYYCVLNFSFLGTIKKTKNIISTEGFSFFAKSIQPLDTTGFFEIKTLTSTTTAQLPYPTIKLN